MYLELADLKAYRGADIVSKTVIMSRVLMKKRRIIIPRRKSLFFFAFASPIIPRRNRQIEILLKHGLRTTNGIVR